MSIVDDFWASSAISLRGEFEQTRRAHKDSSVKGGANEDTLAQFLRENVAPQRVALNSSVIDADGQQSDEVDVLVINENQPFWKRAGGAGQLLIAEGVDVAYQVKARLSAEELRRAIKNARSVKKLFRPLGARSWANASDSDGARFIDRIPFFIFAYESNIAGDAAVKLLTEELAGTPWDQQPDGVFVLDAWSAANFGDNQGTLKVGPPEATGFSLDTERSSLATMLWCHHLFVHRIVHFTHPLQRYHPFTRIGRS